MWVYRLFKNKFLILIVILCLAGYLRFYGITQRGFIDHDEAAYLLESKAITAGLQLMAGHQPIGQISIGTAHPGHTFLIWAASLILGFHDYTGMFVSVVLGILSIGVLFLLGKKMFDTQTGLIAAAILSVSGYHLLYSRSGVTEATLTFFYVLGTFFYYSSRKEGVFRRWPLFVAGICAGYIFTSHYRALIVLVIFVLYELQLSYFEKGLNFWEKLKRWGVLISGACLPPIVFEMPYRLLMLVRGRHFNELQTYYEQLLYRYNTAHGSFSFESFLTYIGEYMQYLRELEHPIVCLLLITGVILICIDMIKKFTIENFILFCGFTIPFTFFSLYRNIDFPLLRSPAIAIPFVALVVGRTIVYISQYVVQMCGKLQLHRKKWLMLGMTILIMIMGLVYDLRFIKIKSGYREAVEQTVDYLLATGKTMSVDPAVYPIWRYYVEETMANKGLTVTYPLIRFSGKQWDNFLLLSANLRAGYHDYTEQRSLGLIKFVETPPDELNKIIQFRLPVVKVPHPADKFLPFFYEGVPRRIAKKAIEQSYAGYIQVFDLEGM